MGALTLKTFSDELREWELIESEGFDITDSFGTSLRLSINNQQIILAEPFDPANPWITDRARLFFDGFFSKKSFHIFPAFLVLLLSSGRVVDQLASRRLPPL